MPGIFVVGTTSLSVRQVGEGGAVVGSRTDRLPETERKWDINENDEGGANFIVRETADVEVWKKSAWA